MSQAVADVGSEDAWSIFKAIVGPGTNEDLIKRTLLKREKDIPELNLEFNDLIRNARKEMAISKSDFDSINPAEMDQIDFFKNFNTGVAISLMIYAAMGAANPLNILFGPIIKVIMDPFVDLMVKSDGIGLDDERERARQAAKVKKATPLFEKIWAKVGGVVQDKSMAEYLRDDGEGEWADWVLKRLG